MATETARRIAESLGDFRDGLKTQLGSTAVHLIFSPTSRLPVTQPSAPSATDSTQKPSVDGSGLDGLLEPINAALRDACEFADGCPPRLAEAIRYALLAPGKRLRPALTLMAAEACGGDLSVAMPAAVAVEMIHAYSLIHDDLPAMDDDDLRRGRPTVHIAFDEATAILAGDALQAEAFAYLCKHVPDAAMAAESVRVLAGAAGAARLVGGQADDLAAEQGLDPEGGEVEEDDEEDAQGPVAAADARRLGDKSAYLAADDRKLKHLESIHRRKTGALIAASLDLGAVLAGADRGSRQALSNYAGGLGLAFQVVDDLLDYTASSETLGKRAGKDSQQGKLTYPGLLGVAAAKEKADQLVNEAKSHIAVFGTAGWRLMWLADYVLKREH